MKSYQLSQLCGKEKFHQILWAWYNKYHRKVNKKILILSILGFTYNMKYDLSKVSNEKLLVSQKSSNQSSTLLPTYKYLHGCITTTRNERIQEFVK